MAKYSTSLGVMDSLGNLTIVIVQNCLYSSLVISYVQVAIIQKRQLRKAT